MNERFGPAAAGSLSPDDATARQRREASAEAASAAGRPTVETEEWRYSPVGDLPLDDLTPSLSRPDLGPTPGGGGPEILAEVERSATVTMVDGWLTEVTVAPGWEAKGLRVETGSPSEVARPEAWDGDGASVFDLLHRAFTPAVVTISVPAGVEVTEPVVVERHHTGRGQASFPHLVVEGAEGAELTVAEHQVSGPEVGLSVPRVELRAGAGSRVRYAALQELGPAHWELARLAFSAATGAVVSCAVAAFGAHYGRLRADGVLTGRGAAARVATAYYGDSNQVHDFRVFQHHRAPDTRSDLLFKGVQDGSSGSVYTGLIHIHPDGAGSNAFQTNRNLKLSPDAWAWSVPNLEIENNEVHCSHASTVSPVDEDQQFYLGSRGVPPVVADRLIVAGFFDEVIEAMGGLVGSEVRHRIEAKLDRRQS